MRAMNPAIIATSLSTLASRTAVRLRCSAIDSASGATRGAGLNSSSVSITSAASTSTRAAASLLFDSCIPIRSF